MSDDIVTRLRDYHAAVLAAPPYYRELTRIAADEIERLRAERDGYLEGNRQTLAALAEANEIAKRYKAERDEVRQSYCSLMEAYRGGDGRVTANKLGWGYLFEEDKPCQ